MRVLTPNCAHRHEIQKHQNNSQGSMVKNVEYFRANHEGWEAVAPNIILYCNITISNYKTFLFTFLSRSAEPPPPRSWCSGWWEPLQTPSTVFHTLGPRWRRRWVWWGQRYQGSLLWGESPTPRQRWTCRLFWNDSIFFLSCKKSWNVCFNQPKGLTFQTE